ncbi:MAG: hypothetical protein JO301_05225 [Chitinophagaceae bacterium]|nr:hypothetical protein [Chitinophagaceae bacterium]
MGKATPPTKEEQQQPETFTEKIGHAIGEAAGAIAEKFGQLVSTDDTAANTETTSPPQRKLRKRIPIKPVLVKHVEPSHPDTPEANEANQDGSPDGHSPINDAVVPIHREGGSY